MNKNRRSFSCKALFFHLILVSFFSTSSAQIDSSVDKGLEERLHQIYVNSYSRPILDSDWFKIVDGLEQQDYVVKRGDTLWGISQVYFGDGHYWSKLWSVNRSITNPHLIGVSDQIRFKSGSMSSGPQISVEGGNESSNEMIYSEDNTQVEQSSGPSVVSMDYSASPIPDTFNTRELKAEITSVPRVVVEQRPTPQFHSTMEVTQEILNEKPPVLGKVVSVGQQRISTGERNRVLIRVRDALSVGQVLTLLSANFKEVSMGHWVHVLGTAKVLSSTGKDYELEILTQYDAINVGAVASSYQMKTVDMDINTTAVKTIPLKVIKDKRKAYWASGDYIFFEMSEANATAGDIISLNNKFSDAHELYYNTGLVRLLSVSPPYATGVILSSNTGIKDNSVSQPQ